MPVPNHPDLPPRRRLRKDETFERLFEAILDGTLVPGERLRDDELRAWLGVSRTPIRLALDRLAEMRLIDSRPHHYTRVSPAEPSRIPQLIEVMCGFWSLAVRRSVAQLDEREVQVCLVGLHRAAAACREQGDSDPVPAVEEMRKALFFFSEHAGNDLLRELVVKVGASLRFQLARAGEVVGFRAFATVFDDLAVEVLGQDPDAAAAVFDNIPVETWRALLPLPAGARPGAGAVA